MSEQNWTVWTVCTVCTVCMYCMYSSANANYYLLSCSRHNGDTVRYLLHLNPQITHSPVQYSMSLSHTCLLKYNTVSQYKCIPEEQLDTKGGAACARYSRQTLPRFHLLAEPHDATLPSPACPSLSSPLLAGWLPNHDTDPSIPPPLHPPYHFHVSGVTSPNPRVSK